MEFLNVIILGNTVGQWLAALLIYFGIYGGLMLLKRLAMRRLAEMVRRAESLGKSRAGLNELIEELGRRTSKTVLSIVALFFASLVLALPVWVVKALGDLAAIAVVIQLGWWAIGAVNHWVSLRLRREEQPAGSLTTTMNAVRLVVGIAVWSMVGLTVLVVITGMGANSLLTTLGVVGVAGALAVQNVLGDLLSALSISLDQPFVIGDAVAVHTSTGVYEGTVERIGLKSTRLRSINGERLTFSNSFLLSNPLRNLSDMPQRRVYLTFNVAYQTPPEKLALIPSIIQESIAAQPHASFDRALLKFFTNLALQYECVYFLDSSDAPLFLEAQQRINQGIAERFAQAGIRFAEPALDASTL